MPTMDESEAREHLRQVLDDQIQITRSIAAATMTLAPLLAYGRADLTDANSDPDAIVCGETHGVGAWCSARAHNHGDHPALTIAAAYLLPGPTLGCNWLAHDLDRCTFPKRRQDWRAHGGTTTHVRPGSIGRHDHVARSRGWRPSDFGRWCRVRRR
jgi:hypothetical protein